MTGGTRQRGVIIENQKQAQLVSFRNNPVEYLERMQALELGIFLDVPLVDMEL